MNVEEIISSGLLESYVIGSTTGEETLLINALCSKHPELLKEIEAIEASLLSYSAQQAPVLRKELKDNITSQLTFAEEKPEQAIIPLNAGKSASAGFYKIGIAASILLLIATGFYIYTLQHKMADIKQQLALEEISRFEIAEQMSLQKASIETLEANFNIVSDPGMKAIPLSGMNSLVAKSAMVHWNPSTQEVYFNAKALPESPESKQYQLWAIVDGKPVDAGVINLENGSVFQKMKQVTGARAFAVTIENAGGNSSPTIDTMCLLGNV